VKSLRLTPEAELDLAEAHAWYSAQRQGLGREFLRAVDTCFAAIRRRPQAYQLVDREIRRALLSRFPYAVFFEVLAETSLSTPSFMERGTHALGSAERTHNLPLQRTGCAGR
jgi:hypothetical protein